MRIALPALLIRRLACALVLAAGIAADTAAAQSPPPPAAPGDVAAVRTRRLDALFAQLRTATVEEEGDAMVAEIWKLWLQSGRPDVDAAMQQAVRLMGHDQPVQALALLDDIVARAPDWAEGWNKRATLLYVLGDHDRSLADIDRTLALEPRHFGALAGIGLIRIARGEHRAALAALRRALAINPFLEERFGLIPALEREIGEKPL
jgi:tetratricopeptide (TPR) repeat protein